MVKTKVSYVISAGCCGAAAVALLIASLASEYWITADLTAPSSQDISTVNYGLFTGTYYRKNIGTTRTFYVYLTCDYGENVCMLSCLDSPEARFDELVQLYKTGTGTFKCTTAISSFYKPPYMRLKSQPKAAVKTDAFIQNSLYVATFSFLIIACVFNCCAVVINIYNIFANPIQPFLSLLYVPTIYLVSLVPSLIVLILWGVEYDSWISNNVALLDTLIQPYKSDASLGWSYFIIIPAFFLSLASGVLLIFRQKLIEKEASSQVIRGDEVNNDANTFMY